MKKFKQVEHLSIIRTYYVNAKDETLKVFSCDGIEEVE